MGEDPPLGPDRASLIEGRPLIGVRGVDIDAEDDKKQEGLVERTHTDP